MIATLAIAPNAVASIHSSKNLQTLIFLLILIFVIEATRYKNSLSSSIEIGSE